MFLLKTDMGVRHMQLLLAFTAYTVSYMSRIDLSVAIVAITDTSGNNTFQKYDWDETTKSTVLSGLFLGYVFSQIPSGYLADVSSPKVVTAIAFIAITICKLGVTQIILFTGWIGLLVIRVIEGLAQGCVIPSITPLIGRWLPPGERMYFNQMLFAGIPFGTLIGLLTSGFLVSTNFGWPLLFYTLGFIFLLFSVLWILFISDNPAKNRFISEEEKKHIEDSLSSVVNRDRTGIRVPWKRIFRCGPFYALLVTHAGRNWGYFTLFTQTPRYISGVWNINVTDAGVLSAIPYAVAFATSIIFSIISLYMHKYNILSLTWRRKMWNTIALFGQSITSLLFIFASPQNLYVVVGYLSFAAGTTTAVFSGLFANQFDLSPNFGGVLMGISTFCGSLAGLMGPYSVTYIVHDKSNVDEWNIVFAISGIISFLASLVYLIFGSAEIQPWNDVGKIDVGVKNVE